MEDFSVVALKSWPLLSVSSMLPLGTSAFARNRGLIEMARLSRDEQYTLMSLWSLFRSPQMMGGDLPTSDAFYL